MKSVCLTMVLGIVLVAFASSSASAAPKFVYTKKTYSDPIAAAKGAASYAATRQFKNEQGIVFHSSDWVYVHRMPLKLKGVQKYSLADGGNAYSAIFRVKQIQRGVNKGRWVGQTNVQLFDVWANDGVE
jgi:hypothetical protein